jgi:predicted DNA-binding transcriptional regulator YafY
MRASRLVSALMLLQARPVMTARQLADELGVSIRTVYRDMESLQVAGVPIYADTGRTGGYRLVEGYRTRLTGLTVDEAQALFLTGLPDAADALGLGPAVAGAERKLRAALPRELRRLAESQRGRFHLDAPGWYDHADAPEHLAEVAAAVWEQRTLTVVYRRWQEPPIVRRVLEPLGLVLKGGRWYLVARPLAGGAPRTYRVNQVMSVESVGEPFSRPLGFDLAAHWRAQLEAFRKRLAQSVALVRLSPAGVERMREVWSTAVVDEVLASASTPDESGWVRADVPIESPAHALTQVLQLGAEVEVLEPSELRQRTAATTAAMAALYV